MTTLTQAEASILSQLREKSMQAHHMTWNLSAPEVWSSLWKLKQAGLFRSKNYVQEYRTVGEMTICHLTHEGRMALIEYEKRQIKL